MNTVVLLVCSLLSSLVFASTKGYDIKMELSINGKKISSPHIIAIEGEAASISQETLKEKMFIQVIAQESVIQNHNGILMDLDFRYTNADGNKNIISKPHILANENELAQITVDETGKDIISITVIAKRKNF